MKRILLLFAIVVMSLTSVMAQSTYQYGYDAAGITLQDTLVSGNIKTAVISGYRSSKYATNHYGLLEMPEKETDVFAGCHITKISFCPFITNSTTGYVVISKEIGGEPLYIQSAAISSHQWTTVTLDTPYEIQKGEHLYIGYRIKANGNDWPIGYYYTSNVMEQNMHIDPILDYVAYEKSNGTVMSGLLDTQTYTARRQTANLMLYATIEGNIPQKGLSMDNMTLSKGEYVHTTDAQTLTTTITNVGTDSIKTFDLTVELDGVKKVSGTQNITIAPLWERTFSMNFPAMPEGLHTVTVSVDRPDGQENCYSGATSMQKEFLVYTDSVQKTVLVEHFTTAKCVNCVAGEKKIQEYIQNSLAKDNCIQVNHHSGYSTDQMTTSEDQAYEWFYGVDKGGSMWAPANMVDRRDFTAYGAKGYGGAATTGPVHGTSGAKTDSLLNVAYRTPGFVTLEVQPVVRNGKELSVSVKGTTLYDLPDVAKKRLNVFLLEDSVMGAQKDADSVITNYAHMNVFRASLTGTWGEPDVITDKTINKTYSYSLPDGMNPENMRVVAFLSDYDSEDNTKCEVYQAAEARLKFIDVANLPYMESDSTIEGAMSTNKYGYTPHGWMFMSKYGAWVYSYATTLSGLVGKAYLYTNKHIHLPEGKVSLSTVGTAIGDDVHYEVYIAPDYDTEKAMKDYSTFVGESGLLRNVLNTSVVDTTVVELTIPEEGDYVVIIRPITEVKYNQMTIASLRMEAAAPAAKGDVNEDGVVDIADVNAVLSELYNPGSYKNADVNGDGVVDIADVNAVLTIMYENE